MGFFKKAFSKVKRVVSLKNLVNGVTGNFTAIGKDVVRVANSPDPRKDVGTPEPAPAVQFSLPAPVTDMLTYKDAMYKKNLEDSVANIPAVQNASNFFSKVYLKAMYTKHKNWILGLCAVLACFLLWKFLFSNKQNTGRRTSRVVRK